MARTTVGAALVRDGGIFREDLNTDATTHAVLTKIIAGTGISISSTGVDAGTGDVTVNASASSVTEDPSNPANGTMWYRSDLKEIRVQIDGVTRKLIVAAI